MKVTCIDKKFNGFLTVGKSYEVILEDSGNYYIRNDMEREAYYDASLFSKDKPTMVSFKDSTTTRIPRFYTYGKLYIVMAEAAGNYFITNDIDNSEWVSAKWFEPETIAKEIIVPEDGRSPEQKLFIVLEGNERIQWEEDTDKLTLTEARAKIKKSASEYGDGGKYYIIKIEELYDVRVKERTVYDVELDRIDY